MLARLWNRVKKSGCGELDAENDPPESPSDLMFTDQTGTLCLCVMHLLLPVESRRDEGHQTEPALWIRKSRLCRGLSVAEGLRIWLAKKWLGIV